LTDSRRGCLSGNLPDRQLEIAGLGAGLDLVFEDSGERYVLPSPEGPARERLIVRG